LGHELSPSVRAAVPEAVRLVLQLIAEVNVCA
jgi:Ni,Fe-hydrogenase maturation factor